MRFDDRVVLITGSGRGIGAATARAFAAEGARLVITDIDGAAAEEVSASIPGSIAVTADVSSPASLASLVARATAELGPVDVLINNAMSCTEAGFLELTEEQVARDLMVSLGGPIFASQAVLPSMIARRGGVILNISSVNGLAYFGNEAYSAAKAGVINLTKSLASQYGEYGIRVNAVAPGSIKTEYWEMRREVDPEVFEKTTAFYPLGRMGQPEDIALALMFLASDDAAWISGITLPVEGGLMAGNLAMARTIVSDQKGR